ncbi:hypothetical protein [Paracoccus methylarcula]|uniref:DUF3955 domain-containing protein n=1 Tax=Paracoccus methylarcula TaxID=72022 RepID=A0A422QTH8_9RHOB|nr:hypothetical protein [Paracoccus methylarcula]RNF33284.1 hypothetical protein A7A09_017835 [Paracoccus methylarcula]
MKANICIMVALLALLLLGAWKAHVSQTDSGYGPEFGLAIYLPYIAAPVIGAAIVGLSIGRWFRWRASKGRKSEAGIRAQ